VLGSLVSHHLDDIPCKNYTFTTIYVFIKVMPETLSFPVFSVCLHYMHQVLELLRSLFMFLHIYCS